jgi:hypothetical protein
MALEITSGYSTLFHQSTPPVNWTKVTTYSDYTLRVVTGSVSSGGGINFTNTFTTQSVSLPGTPTGTIGNAVLTTSQIAPHVHQYYTGPYTGAYGTTSGQLGPQQAINGYNSGSSSLYFSGTSDQGHTHPSGDISFIWSQSGSLDLRIKYVDIIIATRN